MRTLLALYAFILIDVLLYLHPNSKDLNRMPILENYYKAKKKLIA